METNKKQGGDDDGVNLQSDKEESTLYIHDFKGIKLFSSSPVNPSDFNNFEHVHSEVITTSNLEKSIKNHI